MKYDLWNKNWNPFERKTADRQTTVNFKKQFKIKIITKFLSMLKNADDWNLIKSKAKVNVNSLLLKSKWTV